MLLGSNLFFYLRVTFGGRGRRGAGAERREHSEAGRRGAGAGGAGAERRGRLDIIDIIRLNGIIIAACDYDRESFFALSR
jgi:hypothetical protein